MSRDIDLYLDDFIDVVESILDYTSGIDYDDFISNKMCIDAVIKNLLVIGEAVKMIPEEIKLEHPAIDWKNVAGLRDVLIHAYFRIDNDLLWDIIQNKLEDLRDEVLKISE
ncbi:DUF86 domain-containing protein [Methanoplanus sp. FWC-SCC4]|uniref:DUF86 domain-containing protein n=1 Tax=Methanochimaera problematica TaxID=2609417 RepID=A0AA97I3M3_9EURY|nr:DUF86 domain-containing protein [Methanoplanus sp. FWC-SCC4]WOF16046.1 DUF86 domain-containing protein [Methanoplanus sp. FWC-SCC4]